MARLLAPQVVALQLHLLQHIPVAHLGGREADAVFLAEPGKTHVGQHGAHDGGAAQFAPAQHIQPADGHDEVAVHLAAVLVQEQAAVGIAVKGNARHDLVVAAHILGQRLHVGGAAALVDVHAVRRGRQHHRVGAQLPQQRFGADAGRTVRAVHRDLHAVQAAGDGGFQMLDVVAHGALPAADLAQVAARNQRHLVLFVQHQRLDLVLQLVGQLEALAAEDLDAVERVGVVRG